MWKNIVYASSAAEHRVRMDTGQCKGWKVEGQPLSVPLTTKKNFLFFLKYLHANDQSAAIETFKDVEHNLNNFVMLPVIF